MFRNVDEPDFSLRCGEKRFPGFLRLQNSRLPFHAQLFCRKFQILHRQHPQHETFRPVSVELVDDDSPVGIRMQGDGFLTVFQKIKFRAGGTDRRSDRFSGDNMEAGDQAQRAMPDVFKFNAFFLTGSHFFFGAMRSNAWMLVISSMQTVCVSN